LACWTIDSMTAGSSWNGVLVARTPAELHTYVGWTCPGG
jgi:hypothetical protein